MPRVCRVGGWAPRHPSITDLLGTAVPAVSGELEWEDGTYLCRLDTFVGAAELPEEFVGSVRCLVLVDDRVVICTNADQKSHPWPGGRREPGETYADTACREIHEETGWLLDPGSLEHVGWLHFEHLRARPALHKWDHADFLMTVYVGRASDRDGGRDNPWSDTEGHELSSELLSLDDAIELVALHEPNAIPFLNLLKSRGE